MTEEAVPSSPTGPQITVLPSEQRRAQAPLALDLDALRGAAWELGHSAAAARAFLRARLDPFVAEGNAPDLRTLAVDGTSRRYVPVWFEEVTPPPDVLAETVLETLVDETSTLGTMERCAAARAVGIEIEGLVRRVVFVLEYLGRTGTLRTILDMMGKRDHFNNALRKEHAYEPTSGSSVPSALFLQAINATSAAVLPDRLRQEMDRLAAWRPRLPVRSVRVAAPNAEDSPGVPRTRP